MEVILQTVRLIDVLQWAIFMHLYFTNASVDVKKTPSTPTFLHSPSTVTAYEGEQAVLHCAVKNLGSKMIVWRKSTDKSPLTIGNRAFSPESGLTVDYEKLSKSESRWDLKIRNVKKSHAGLYQCQVTSSVVNSHNVTLTVLEPKVYSPALRITGTDIATAGEDIHLICNASGSSRAPEEVDWFFDGNKIRTSNPRWKDRIQILKRIPLPGRSYISELIIEKSTVEDRGNYICRSSDMAVNTTFVHVLNTEKDVSRRGTGTGEEIPILNSKYMSAAAVSRLHHISIFLVALQICFCNS